MAVFCPASTFDVKAFGVVKCLEEQGTNEQVRCEQCGHHESERVLCVESYVHEKNNVQRIYEYEHKHEYRKTEQQRISHREVIAFPFERVYHVCHNGVYGKYRGSRYGKDESEYFMPDLYSNCKFDYEIGDQYFRRHEPPQGPLRSQAFFLLR